MDHVATKDDLEALFSDRSSFGLSEDATRLPDGEDLDNATAICRYVRRALGDRAALYGFLFDDNPTARVSDTLAGGHDFAVVDHRYVVDGWVPFTPSLGIRQAVFDLTDAADRAIINRLYGDMSTWERMISFEDRIDQETSLDREWVMRGTMFTAPAPDLEAPVTPAF